MTRQARIVAALILVAATAIVYWRAMESPFQFDDEAGIVLNPSIQNLTDLRAIFSYKPELPRPLFNLSLAVDYSLHGLGEVGYHLTNLLIHILGAFIVWWLASEINRLIAMGRESAANNAHAEYAPIMAAFIFALHPVATEPTIYVWSRSSSMMTIFCLLSLALYLKAWRGGKYIGWMAASLVAFVMGVLSKEEAVSLPALILAVDWIILPKEGRSKRFVAQAPFWLVPIVAVIYRVTAKVSMYDLISWRVAQADEFAELVLKHGVRGMAPINLLTQLKLGLYQAFMLTWPINQSVDHGVQFEVGAPSMAAWAGILFTIAAVALFFYGRTRMPRAALAVAFFFIPIAMFYVVPVSDAYVERRLYLPLAGWAILLGSALTRCVDSKYFADRKRLGTAFLVMPILLLAGLTYNRSIVWGNKLLFWGDAVRVSPDKLRPRVMLARYLYDEGYVYRAIHENLAAIHIKPSFGPPIVNLGLIYLNQNDFQTAEKYFRQAIHWHPRSDFNAHFNLGVTLDKEGRREEAIEEFMDTVRINTGHALAMQEMGRICAEQGNPNDAVGWFERALKINPDLATARMNLGNALFDLGQAEEGLRQLELASKQAPDDGLVWFNLGLAYLSMGMAANAETAFNNASRDSGRPEALFGLAQVMIQENRLDQARALLERFVQSVDPAKRPELAPLVNEARRLLQ